MPRRKKHKQYLRRRAAINCINDMIECVEKRIELEQRYGVTNWVIGDAVECIIRKIEIEEEKGARRRKKHGKKYDGDDAPGRVSLNPYAERFVPAYASLNERQGPNYISENDVQQAGTQSVLPLSRDEGMAADMERHVHWVAALVDESDDEDGKSQGQNKCSLVAVK